MNTILTMHLIYRRIFTLRTINKQYLHSSVNVMSTKDSSSDSSSSDSDSGSDSDSDNRNKEIKKQPEDTSSNAKKESSDLLNNLLTKMITETSATRTFRSVPKRIKEPKPLTKPSLEQSIITAAKETADYLGGDTEKTRSTLIDKVFSAGIPPQATQAEKPTEKSKDIKHGSEIYLSELLSGMKIERTPEQNSTESKYSRASKIEELSRRFNQRQPSMMSLRIKEAPVNLFDQKRLGIFDKIQKDIVATQQQQTTILRALEQKEMKLLLEHPPENIFQEMIQWTEKGLLWKFPINNEIGYEEEESIPFSEHVFIERHIEDWCPKKGPIRYFMELVCIGLSKNPYMKVQEKIDHIMWYKEFFGTRQELLKEIGAIKEDILPSKNAKQIEA